jgi:hypothetical protein
MSPALAAYVALWRVHAQQFRMDVVVDPAWRRRGFGAALVDFLVSQAESAKATSLQARPYAGGVDALRVLHARAFHETMRMTGLELDDPSRAELAPLSELRRALERGGIRITTLAAELECDPQSWEKLRDANQAAQFGWPDPDPRPDGRPDEPETVEEFRARAELFGLLPEACFVAVMDDRMTGSWAIRR